MKKNITLFCVLFCLCFAACEGQNSPENTDGQSLGTSAPLSTPEGEAPNAVPDEVPSAIPSEVPGIVSPRPLLRASNAFYMLPPNDAEVGGVNWDLMVYDPDQADNCAILFDILGSDVVVDYGDNTYRYMPMQDIIQAPGLYHFIQYFNVSQEALLEAYYARVNSHGTTYKEDMLRAMYLPYEDMLKATLEPRGAYLNGNVYNIQTLNELFETDKEAFSKIKLEELVEYQERLEEEGIDYGFNQDMVDFANQNCR